MSRKNKAVDPICGMEIERCKISTTYKGATYYFCLEECRREFEKNPGKYITENPPARKIEMHRYSTHHCC
jgi:YHS domain-containing protein